jgi:hypothetical protein
MQSVCRAFIAGAFISLEYDDLMISALFSALGSDRYYPHAICLAWDPLMLWCYTIFNLGIWASYMVIGGALVIYRMHDMRVTRLSFDLFAGFIVLCGLTHLTDAVTLYSGLYRLDLLARVATTVVSAATAVHMIRRLANEEDDAVDA